MISKQVAPLFFSTQVGLVMFLQESLQEADDDTAIFNEVVFLS